MTVGSFVVAILVIGLCCLITQYAVPEPAKRFVLILLAVVLVLWLVSGFFPGLANHRIP